MGKNNLYFSHDSNARNDEKILAVRMKLGVEGYGIYFMLLERLLESDQYILIKDYNVIAFDLRVGSDKIKSVIEDFGLFAFTEDGKRFYSEGLINRMKPLENLRKQRSEAGKRSAEKRKTNGRSTVVEEKSNETQFLLTEISTEKVNESKVNNVLLKKEPKERESTRGDENFLEDDFSNPSLLNSGEETLSKSCDKKFSLVWNSFAGKKVDFEKDFKKFQEKTKGLEVDFEKLLREAPRSRNIYFQSWLNDFFPKSTTAFDFKKAMLDFGFEETLVEEWLLIRKKHKAVNSEYAFNGFIEQIKKSHLSPNETLKIIADRQWRGFNAEWIKDLKNGKNNNSQNRTNSTGQGAGYTTRSTGGKITARQLLARELERATTSNDNSQNFTN